MAVNDVDSTFKRAALFQACKRSAILSNIKFETANTDTLIELVNHNNSHSVRELPILVSKAITKTLLSVIVGRFPKLKTYINPENIHVRIEDDEMAYLIATPTKRPSSIITIVVKNIALNAIGSSIEAFKDTLLKGNNNNGGDDTANENRDIEIERISINLPQVPLNLAAPPSIISQFGSKSIKSNSSGASVKSVKRLNANNLTNSRSSSRRCSFNSDSSSSRSSSNVNKKDVALSPTDRQPDEIVQTLSPQSDNENNQNNDDINNNINNNIINTNNITFISNNRNEIDDDDDNEEDDNAMICMKIGSESTNKIMAHYNIEKTDNEKREDEMADDEDLMMVDEEGEIPSSVIENSEPELHRQRPTIINSSPVSVDFMNLVGPHLSSLADKLRPPQQLLNISKPNVKSEKKRNFEFLD